jgi:uncharacterized OB-fold protein
MSNADTVEQVPVAPGVFTWPADEPQLIGSYFPESGVTTFPQSSSCPKTSSRNVEQVLLPRRGTLWSWTIQGFLPKSPPYAGKETAKDFVPYGVGYVQLGEPGKPGGVIVESRLTENDPEKLQIGMELELVIIPFTTDDQGRELLTYAFSPVTTPTSTSTNGASS